MTEVIWDPSTRTPTEAPVVEEEIALLLPSGTVKLTWVEPGGWRVRALGPVGLCTRGEGFAGRDLSARIALLLEDAGLAVTD